ncbi:hypothetical protein TWF696_003634 [Orbilia brochopaga]|uniref:Uncharacterized protein n=1 Tax=Orbilia brochopaga TaxID=3140254 RepID=A0AAV9TWU4_9PEZI
MPRAGFYAAALVAFVGASVLTLTAITIPRWMSYSYETSAGRIMQTYGLHHRCRSGPGTIDSCEPFPLESDCADDEHFCSLWRTTGYLMDLAVSLEVLIIAAYVIILIGGRERREKGWKLLSSLLFVNVALQLIAMSLVSYVYENDERFFVGWKLDVSWVLCTFSWGITLIIAGMIAMVGWLLPPEDGYERLDERRSSRRSRRA